MLARAGRLARCALAASILSATLSHAAGAQGTSLLAAEDLAYRDLDRLAELGIVTGVAGQRPYSRREIARIIRAARSQVDGAGWTDEQSATRRRIVSILDRLDARFAPTESAAESGELFERITTTAGATDSPRRAFVGTLASGIEATLGPLATRRLGRPAVRGGTLALELAHRAEPTRWLAVQAAERVELRNSRDRAGAADAELLLGSVRARAGNVALLVGRQQLGWAQGAGDGLFLASDAPALDLVSLSSDRPFLLPGFLGRLGPAQATLVVADLGLSVVRSHSKLLAYKVSVLPAARVELGATFMNHYGGVGGRSSTLGDRVIDFLPFVDIFRAHNYKDTTRVLDVDSDKLLGVDGRVRFPRLGGLLLTGELLIDDFDVHRIPTLFTWDGAQTVGFVLPALGGPEWSARLSAKHTGVRTYAHGALTNGITSRGRLLGDELGPDAKSFGAEVRWEPGPSTSLSIEGRSALHSKAVYASEESGTHFLIRRVGDASNEQRDRAIAMLRLTRGTEWAGIARVAVERVRNADFTGGRRRDFAVELALRLAR